MGLEPPPALYPWLVHVVSCLLFLWATLYAALSVALSAAPVRHDGRKGWRYSGRRPKGGQRRAQTGEADGLEQAVVHAGGEAKLPLARLGMGGEAPDGQVMAKGSQVAGQLEAVHHRHLAVGDDQIEGVAGEGAQGLQAIAAHTDVVSQMLDLLAQQDLVGVIVIDHQDMQPMGEGLSLVGLGRRHCRDRGGGLLGEREGQPYLEAGAFADLAVNGYLPPPIIWHRMRAILRPSPLPGNWPWPWAR